MTKLARYIIILDRYDDDDYPPAAYAASADRDELGMEQVARELQEAMEQTGEPAGFFRVVARAELDYAEAGPAIHTVTPDRVAHFAAMQVLDKTRTY